MCVKKLIPVSQQRHIQESIKRLFNKQFSKQLEHHWERFVATKNENLFAVLCEKNLRFCTQKNEHKQNQ